jgi:hypothetical protein
MYVLYQYECTLPEGESQERVKICKNPRVLIVKTSHLTIVHSLVYY